MYNNSSVSKRYADRDYQAAHDETYAHPLDPKIPSVLPPGVTRPQFDEALRKWEQALGPSCSVVTGQDLKDFVDPYELPEEGYERRTPGAAICPGSVDDLRAALKIANEYKIPVWVVSRGKNLGYGGPSPVVSGSVVFDLHRINKIIEVNEKLAYAVVEPGVTFTDLYNYIVERKLKVWPSTASLGWGSVIGNTLDRGMGFIPMGLHHHHIAGLEVLHPTGADLLRTGQFSATTSPAAHLTTLSFGPTVDGLFLQSNLGIVTKMGIHLQRQPEAYLSARLDMPQIDDLATIVDLLRELRLNGVLAFTYVYPILMEATLHKPRREWYADLSVPVPEWRLREMMAELDCGYWLARLSLMGPLHMIEAHYAEVERVVRAKAPTGRLSRAVFTGDEDGALVDAAKVPIPHGGQFVGVPGIEGLMVTKMRNSVAKREAPGAHVAYSPILPLEGEKVLEWFRCAKGIYERNGCDVLEDFYFDDRCAISICEAVWEKTDGEQRKQAARLSKELFEAGRVRGLTKYRSHVNHMDMGADLFDYNDHSYRRFVETLKDSLDPNGILSPGKQGIWPRRLRHLSKRETASKI